jgi:polyhydroxybutyrate depolymerase
VVLVTVEGGGHTRPGRPASAVLGRSTRNVAANDLIWEFFTRHPMG